MKLYKSNCVRESKYPTLAQIYKAKMMQARYKKRNRKGLIQFTIWSHFISFFLIRDKNHPTDRVRTVGKIYPWISFTERDI